MIKKEVLETYIDKNLSQQGIANATGFTKGQISAALRKYKLTTKKKPSLCKSCSSTISRRNEYCNNKCQQNHQHKSKVKKWLSGNLPGWTGETRQLRSFVRKWVKSTRGSACEDCGWDLNHPVDGASLTEIDHIDGNAENCTPDNLRVLCPNCHSMTPTFRTRNKESKRNR